MGRMRVIAGCLGGRALVAPRGASTRPTSDRVREALFSILGDIKGTRVIDLYAGTGALGIEALSRGAEHATFVDHARQALEALRRNVRDLGIEQRCTVLPVRVERLIGAPSLRGDGFDLVLADPPYSALRDAKVLESLGLLLGVDEPAFVRCGGKVVLEHSRSLEPPAFSGLSHDDLRIYGDTALSFYSRLPVV
jgi:16S rRNA (guanine966-N2)-methyltransferase